jgi:hypothetical protein
LRASEQPGLWIAVITVGIALVVIYERGRHSLNSSTDPGTVSHDGRLVLRSNGDDVEHAGEPAVPDVSITPYRARYSDVAAAPDRA